MPIFAVLLTFAAFIFSSRAQAYEYPMDGERLKGIDTISVGFIGRPESILLATYFRNTRGEIMQDVLAVALQDIFSKEKRVLVVSNLDEKGSTIAPNTLYMDFLLSAQQEEINGKPVKVAALWVKYRYYLTTDTLADMKAFDATYPFIVPDTREEFLKKIDQGVHFLTGYLPKVYNCANTGKVEQSGDCSKDCWLRDPWPANTPCPDSFR